MKLEDIWNSFTDKICNITIAKLEVTGSSNLHFRDHESLAKTLTLGSKKTDDKTLHSKHRLRFFNPFTNKDIFLPPTELTLAEAKKRISDRQNRQFQWLLAESYEEFELFLNAIDAFIAFHDRNFWKLQDFGNVTFNQLDQKDFTWFLSQSKKKNNIPKSIINNIKIYFPDFTNVEKYENGNCNLTFHIVLIEKLRHVIVHNHGNINDKEEFVTKIAKEAGFYKNGRIDEFPRKCIERYITCSGDRSFVDLSDIKNEKYYFTDRMHELIETLLSFSFIIYTYTKENEFSSS